jgi:ABC-2 type transport system permease protein
MRDTTRPVGFVDGARGVFELTVETMIWSRRSLFAAILLGLPVLFAILYRVVLAREMEADVNGWELYGFIVAFYYIHAAFIPGVLPLIALFYGSALIAEEVEGKTITYLLTRPVRRGSILAGKFAAYLATTLSLALPAVIVTFFLLVTEHGFRGVGARVPDLFRDMGVVSLTLVVYGALFTLMGVVLKRPVILGLLFLFGWELVSNLPGDTPKYTVTTWLRSLVKHRPMDEGLGELFAQVQPVATSLEVIGAMIVVFLVSAAWIFGRKEYVLEQ